MTYQLPEHLHTFDGNLYDTRVNDWSSKPVRANYKRHHRTIETVADLKATLRAGPFAWPGGYPLFFITSDGGALSFDTARTEFRYIADSIANRSNDGWCIVGCEINYEDTDLQCDHTGNRIASAFSLPNSEFGLWRRLIASKPLTPWEY